jgi:hypothetical protein
MIAAPACRPVSAALTIRASFEATGIGQMLSRIQLSAKMD